MNKIHLQLINLDVANQKIQSTELEHGHATFAVIMYGLLYAESSLAISRTLLFIYLAAMDNYTFNFSQWLIVFYRFLTNVFYIIMLRCMQISI